VVVDYLSEMKIEFRPTSIPKDSCKPLLLALYDVFGCYTMSVSMGIENGSTVLRCVGMLPTNIPVDYQAGIERVKAILAGV
jgi:hypothetical protein